MPSSGRASPSTPILQRSSSLTTLPETDKRRKAKPQDPKKSPYRGRMSLGGRNASIAIKVEQRRKSRLNHHQYSDDERDDYDYTPNSAHSHSSTRLFNCLPVVENQENATPVLPSRKISAVSTATEFEWEEADDPHLIGDVERRRLYNEFYSFLERDNKSSNLVVNQQNFKVKNAHMFSFTVDGREEKHKLGDYLWLVLKAYFAGKEVRGHFDAAVVYDPHICRLRQEKIGVLQKILDLRFDAQFEEEMPMSTDYLSYFVEQRGRLVLLLEEVDRFEALFPHRKAMADMCSKKINIDAVEARLNVLYAWRNTADQLCDKIEQFGQMLGVSHSTMGAEGWPRPLHGVAPSSEDCAYAIVRAFVTEMLSVKGMRKVLNRVSHLCDELLLRATVLLQQPAHSYAQAAGTQRTLIHMTEEMRDKYGETARGCLWNAAAHEMHLPSLLPLFLFVLGVRLQMVLEWLAIRAMGKLPDGSEMDLLTLKTFVEESRDCIEEAVRVKRHYLDTVAYTCKDAVDFVPKEYDENLLAVFKNYLFFVQQLGAAFFSTTPPCMFSHLEKQWSAAWKCAPFIDGGIEALTRSFCDILCSSIDKVVIEYWEGGVYRITEGLDDGSVESDGEAEEGEREMRRRRKLFKLVRDVQERAARAFTVARLMLGDIMTASCFVPTQDHVFVANALKDHVLISPNCADLTCAWPVSLLCLPSDQRSIHHLLTTVHEGGIPESNHLVVLPVPFVDFSALWTYDRSSVNLCKKVAANLSLLRIDRVVVVGSFGEALQKRHPSVFRLCSQNSAAFSYIHQCMGEFASRLDVFSLTVWDKVCEVVTHRSFGESDNRRAAHSALLTMFNFCFQFHREVGRVVWEVHELRTDFAERCVSLLEKWLELVVPSVEIRPAPHIPLWAKLAFTFMLHMCEFQWTQHMSDAVFVRLRDVLRECQDQIVRGQSGEEVTLSASRQTSDRESGESSPRSATTSQHDRLERLRAAAQHTEKEGERRRQAYLPLGKVVNKRREEYIVTNYANTTKKAPFQWQLLEKIGEGNFGNVYKGLNVDKGCVIAVKQIRAPRGQMLKVLVGEVDILRNLSHKNLVKYYGMEVQGDDVLIFMELCAEGTLERICREGMDMTLVRRYANHLLQAVEYIHDNKVIHRDIKPANIFLDLSCVLKLGDFGSSIRLRDNATVCGEFRDFVGTPNYMAPETYTGGEELSTLDGKKEYKGYGRAVDIWSIGCVVLEMVTGRRPWDRCDIYQIAMALGNKRKPAYPNNCPQILRHFLDSCLEMDGSRRPTASVMLNDPFVNIHTDPQGTIGDRFFP